MSQQGNLQDKLVAYIQDMYALENAGVETLERHAKQAEDVPMIQERILRHLQETKNHRTRLEERLHAHGATPSATKGALGAVTGAAAGLASGARPDRIAMNARDEYVDEHAEIASYAMLLATAQAHGDGETVDVVRQNLRDEVAMQEWLARHVAAIGLLALQKDDGVVIPNSAWEFARTTASVAAILGSPSADAPDDTDIKAAADATTPDQSGQIVGNVDW